MEKTAMPSPKNINSTTDLLYVCVLCLLLWMRLKKVLLFNGGLN